MAPFQDLARRISLDRAVGYALAVRLWQVPAGVLTTILIAWHFDETTQGVYFTLLSLIGLQALADSGLLNVLMHAVSHEWAGLRLDARGFLRGPRHTRRRVAAMVRFGVSWFFLGGLVLVVLGTTIGIAVFVRQGVTDTVIGPLMAAMLFAGGSIMLAPLIATLEGFNQVQHVNRYRLLQAITGSLVVWSALAGGADLWTPVFAVLTQFVWELILLVGRYGRLFHQIWNTRGGRFDWRVEIWPLQWRIGVQSAARYLAFFPLIPTLFAWQGAEIAGRMGMTWSVLNNLLLAAYAWIRTRAPEFGRLIASGKTRESNLAFYKATAGSTLMLVVAVSSFWLVLVILRGSSFEPGVHVAQRFLDPSTTLWFAIAMLPLHLTQCFAIHIRSQKMDPIWRITVVANLILAAAVFWAASRIGVDAVGAVMLVVFTIVMGLVFGIWVKYDRLLQASSEQDRLS